MDSNWFSWTIYVNILEQLLKIITWYGRLRDTLAGKILTTFQKYFYDPQFQIFFYRQKCRAAAEFMDI